jgi:hypothetical protein
MTSFAKMRVLFSLVTSAIAAVNAVSDVREAKRDRDTLALTNAVANILAMITGAALAVRTLRKGEEKP